jgi:aldehyde:ferredoxin oxidoreductase
MPASINGAVLHIDLSQGRLEVEHPPEAFYRTYGGGSGMGLVYLLRQLPSGADPLGPQNVLTLFTGPATGLAVSGQSRISANALSPLGNVIGDSQAGGFFPAALKFAGFDGLVIQGKSPRPVYLLIDEGKARLLDASELWGKDTAEVDRLLGEKYGSVEVLQAGIAGEKLVRFAALMNMHNRANGRTGMGAVMGSKLLKAVVVRGQKKLQAAHPDRLARMNREGTRNIPNIPDMKGLAANGTADGIPFQQAYGTLPGSNYNEGTFDRYLDVSGEQMTDTILKKRETCFACSVRCKRVVETEYRGRKVDPGYGGPEYETIATLGTYCGISDLDAIALGNQLCNQYGLDTISCGAAISFAMECFEKGILTPADTGGLDLKFGNPDAMLEMVQQIGERQGLGDILAEGTVRAAKIIGRGSEECLIAVKGTELPAHMPQAKKTLGLIYAVNAFGADHQSHEHDPMYEEGVGAFYLERLAQLGLTSPQPVYSLTDEKVRYAYLTQIFFSALDTYSLCQFVYGPSWELYGPQDMADILSAATGWDVSVAEIMGVGERRLNMLRAFNAREGFTRRDDTLPKKVFKPLQGKGPTGGTSWKEADLEHAKDVYYQLAGWDAATGNPGPAKLAALGLDWIKDLGAVSS